jgi:hypothetical protein
MMIRGRIPKPRTVRKWFDLSAELEFEAARLEAFGYHHSALKAREASVAVRGAATNGRLKVRALG